MSHTVSIKTQFKDVAAIASACTDLGLPAPITGTHKLFSTTETGVAVRLNGWTFPIVIDTATGEAKADNYNERWGKNSELQRFTQAYAVAKATALAKSKGLIVRKQIAANGTVKLVCSGF